LVAQKPARHFCDRPARKSDRRVGPNRESTADPIVDDLISLDRRGHGADHDHVLELAIAKLRWMLPPDEAAQISTTSIHFPFLGNKP
jgi:hypothetical protein